MLNYYCNFMSLHNWIKQDKYCEKLIDDESYKVSEISLHKLKDYLTPMYKEVIVLDENDCFYWDENCWPNKYQGRPIFNWHEFSPIKTGSTYKLITLYHNICTLINFISNDFDNEYEIYYECSY